MALTEPNRETKMDQSEAAARYIAALNEGNADQCTEDYILGEIIIAPASTDEVTVVAAIKLGPGWRREGVLIVGTDASGVECGAVFVRT